MGGLYPFLNGRVNNRQAISRASRRLMGGFFMKHGDKLIRGYKPSEFNTPDIFKYKTNLTANARLVYLFLIRHYAIEGDTAPSKNEIAYYLECSKRTVDEAIKELIKAGLVQVIHRKKKPKQNDNNMYIFYHPEQVGIELKQPFEELKYKKQKATKKLRQGSAEIAPPEVVQKLHHSETSSAEIALPSEKPNNDADFAKQVVQKLHGTSLLDLDRLIDSETEYSDEQIVKIAFKEYFKEEISDKQAESFVDVAVEQALSLQEIVAEMDYIVGNVKIKTTAAATLYSSLNAGGWAKKKKEEAEKKPVKPKRRLARKPNRLPESIQSEEQDPGETNELPLSEEELAQKQAAIKEKLRRMNERLLVK
jgi:DNA-binding transcriptional regulator YhcF (GntR family)